MFRQNFEEVTSEKVEVQVYAKDYKYYGKIGFVVPNPSLILFLHQPTQKFVEQVDYLIESRYSFCSCLILMKRHGFLGDFCNVYIQKDFIPLLEKDVMGDFYTQLNCTYFK